MPFCKVPLFLNGMKGCHFCWLPFLFGVFDGAVCFFTSSYVYKKYSLGLPSCNYLLFYQ